jgi:hypothetical protein
MEEIVERECLLFEAGDYPDKGVSVTMGDLVEIARNSAADIPVRIEHLPETPFDGALGVVGDVRAAEGRLWGKLKIPAETWSFVQRAGAKALSVALDMAAKRLTEVSFVSRPRIRSARVFYREDNLLRMEVVLPDMETRDGSLKRFVDGLLQYVRNATKSDEASRMERERQELENERAALRGERANEMIAQFKRKGLLRGTQRAEEMARAFLLSGESNEVRFGEEFLSFADLFSRFLEENGSVVPMGEVAPSMPEVRDAADHLVRMAHETARKEGIGFANAFRKVSEAYPELAAAARDEGFGAGGGRRTG